MTQPVSAVPSKDPSQAAPVLPVVPAVESVKEPVAPAAPAEAKQTTPEVKTLDLSAEAETLSGAVHPEVRPHAFVIMPFGKKKGGDGSLYDFNAIYSQLIKPSLEAAALRRFAPTRKLPAAISSRICSRNSCWRTFAL